MNQRIRNYLIDGIVYYGPLVTIGSGAAILFRLVVVGSIR